LTERLATTARTSRLQDAFRILVLLRHAGAGPDDLAPAEAVAMIRGQMRLQALDFWLRNPDYLANELINEYESGRRGAEALTMAAQIMASEEPDLRRYPMVRYRFGAYEPLDDALAILRLPEYVAIARKARGNRVGQHRYYLLKDGDSALAAILADVPDLTWYSDRARVVAEIAGSSGGKQLKDRQYLQADYKSTPQGSRIGPITEAVRTRLREMSTT
jgi:hypothetical protein